MTILFVSEFFPERFFRIADPSLSQSFSGGLRNKELYKLRKFLASIILRHERQDLFFVKKKSKEDPKDGPASPVTKKHIENQNPFWEHRILIIVSIQFKNLGSSAK
jgi:hypothetical protein